MIPVLQITACCVRGSTSEKNNRMLPLMREYDPDTRFNAGSMTTVPPKVKATMIQMAVDFTKKQRRWSAQRKAKLRASGGVVVTHLGIWPVGGQKAAIATDTLTSISRQSRPCSLRRYSPCTGLAPALH